MHCMVNNYYLSDLNDNVCAYCGYYTNQHYIYRKQRNNIAYTQYLVHSNTLILIEGNL